MPIAYAYLSNSGSHLLISDSNVFRSALLYVTVAYFLLLSAVANCLFYVVYYSCQIPFIVAYCLDIFAYCLNTNCQLPINTFASCLFPIAQFRLSSRYQLPNANCPIHLPIAYVKNCPIQMIILAYYNIRLVLTLTISLLTAKTILMTLFILRFDTMTGIH